MKPRAGHAAGTGIVALALGPEGLRLAHQLREAFPGLAVHAHSAARRGGALRRGRERSGAMRSDRATGEFIPFERVQARVAELFGTVRGFIFLLPAGVAVRALAPLLGSKKTDPAAVVVDVLGRWAVSLVGGHEGGANDLAFEVANALGAEPIVTTTSEAAKDLVVGVGCRRGVAARTILTAIRLALRKAGAGMERVRLLASADVKRDEAGLRAAAERLGVPIRFLAGDEIRQTRIRFARSALAQRKVGLPAVAEPAALLAGRRTTLLVPRIARCGVTVAVAQENSSS